MTRIAHRPEHQDAPGGPVIRPVDDAGRRAALALLMAGKPDPNDSAVGQFLAFAKDHHLSLDRFYAAYDGSRPLACALIVPGAGRTAMLFSSPTRRSGEADVLVEVVRYALDHIDTQQIKLVQSLTDPGQRAERAALERGGLRYLSHLVYMHRFVEAAAKPTALIDPGAGRPLRALHWSEQARPRFEQAILRSYEGTMDCPGLLGVRDIDDIIAGHQAAGRFDPGLWTVFEAGGEPAAVLLLSEVPAREAYELVYLGVSMALRGKKLGSAITEHALGAIGARGGGRLHLAVDEHNVPAMRLYRHHGFRANAHKVAMIWTLENGS